MRRIAGPTPAAPAAAPGSTMSHDHKM
jgi:hypothetical protein